jgi:hypothetical protein
MTITQNATSLNRVLPITIIVTHGLLKMDSPPLPTTFLPIQVSQQQHMLNDLYHYAIANNL